MQSVFESECYNKQRHWYCALIRKARQPIFNQLLEELTDFCVSPNSNFRFFSLSRRWPNTVPDLSKDPLLQSACSLSPRPSTASLMKMMMRISSPCSLLTRWSPSCSHGDRSDPQVWGPVSSGSVSTGSQFNQTFFFFFFFAYYLLSCLNWNWTPSLITQVVNNSAVYSSRGFWPATVCVNAQPPPDPPPPCSHIFLRASCTRHTVGRRDLFLCRK